MRSNDAWFGLVHDVFAFTMLQEMVARDLEVGIGTYTHFVASLHLYEDTLEKARNFVNEGLQSTISPMDPMPDGSPWQSIKELLRAEQQARAGIPIADAQLPEDPYWADLARIFFAHHSKQAGRSDEAERINSSIRLQPISELLMRKSTRGRN
jgi:thymidylate synthase